MSDHALGSNESAAAEAFSRQSAIFDELYGNDRIIAYKRERVRSHILQHLPLQARLLELNCGTGEDALYFAANGFRVHATDISSGMMEVFQEKIRSAQGGELVTTEQCSFLALEELKDRGPYDHIYSNFGGLNCTGDLGKVLDSFDSLLLPGGKVTLVIISSFSLWESLLVFRGKFRTAFRRFFSRRGRKANVEGRTFSCFYYKPSFISNHLLEKFEQVALEGLCTIVPPSYIENFGEKHPRLFRWLKAAEDRNKSRWPWKVWGDYFIITLKKK
jgi:ubiquinone/menaquinone biosynthesis C-methylase UbiE